MKRYSRVFRYLKDYKGSIVWYLFTTLMAIIFSVISLGMLFPFLQLLFKVNSSATEVANQSKNGLMRWVNEQLTGLIKVDPLYALGVVCLMIIVSILLKNMFLYLSARTIGPMKNAIATRIRTDMYDKILKLPIGYFTEQRKGDLMSRMTTDLWEIEYSMIGALEGWVKDPLSILINLGVLFYISPKLTIVILVCLPIMGIAIGRVSRSLKRQSQRVADKNSETLSTIDETLGGTSCYQSF
ncbi:MAG: ABC transporter transmembrane domain-containing protein [Ferruginibacter sp.]